MSSIRLENIVKKFGSVISVNNVSLEIADGEFVIFVGPSGCGKTTTLRMIGGLENPTSGKIFFDGKMVNYVQPADRNVAMVFQNFALYPHMTARENITLSLRVKKVKPEVIESKLNRVAAMLNITHLLERKPAQLSGGEKQRVAVGRAIIREPNALLMDEPLSNLDAKLRLTMRAEIKTLVREIGITTIYVTHDQVEAMTLGDTLVVMNKGSIQQIDTPMGIYNNPKNMFVAGMIGSPPINFFHGNLLKESSDLFFTCDSFRHFMGGWKGLEESMGKKIVFGVRPNAVQVVDNAELADVSGSVILFEQHGTEAFVHISTGSDKLLVQVNPEKEREVGSLIHLKFNEKNILLFDDETELRIGEWS